MTPQTVHTQGNETLFPNWQKESWQTFEETSGYVRPERFNKWPNSMTYIYDDDDDDDDDDDKQYSTEHRGMQLGTPALCTGTIITATFI